MWLAMGGTCWQLSRTEAGAMGPLARMRLALGRSRTELLSGRRAGLFILAIDFFLKENPQKEENSSPDLARPIGVLGCI